MTKKVDAGFIQDQYHYALAMQGNTDSAFDCETLVHRLDAAKNAAWAIDHLSMSDNSKLWEWDEHRPRYDKMRSDEDLKQVGAGLQSVAEKYAKDFGVCARTGEKLNENNN